MLSTYEDFAACVDRQGFMTLSANPEGWPSVGGMTESAKWFTGDPESDPWQWRVRIVGERRAAYAKVFRGMPSFISRQWYPFVIAARRGGQTFDELWERGMMREEAKRIYAQFTNRTLLATHEIKRLCGFTGKAKGRYDTAMNALQAGMFITTAGMTRMTTPEGRPYSWPVTEYSRLEDWTWPETMERAEALNAAQAYERIADAMKSQMPGISAAVLRKFILG